MAREAVPSTQDPVPQGFAQRRCCLLRYTCKNPHSELVCRTNQGPLDSLTTLILCFCCGLIMGRQSKPWEKVSLHPFSPFPLQATVVYS